MAMMALLATDGFHVLAATAAEMPTKLLLSGAGLAAAVLAAAAFLIHRRRRRTSRQWFPDVIVGTRLGAPFGGGKISIRSYDRGTRTAR